jgi:outer membrane protein OmpA-like peptidoglycan-associated protein
MSPRAGRSGLLVGLLVGTVLLPASPVVAAGATGGAALGPHGASVQVLGLRRLDGGTLQLSVLVSNHGTDTLQVADLRQYDDQRPTVGVAVLDPSTRKIGDAVGTPADCKCVALPPFIDAAMQATTTVTLADPGGSTLDVLFDAFQPVTAVPVAGAGSAAAANGVRLLEPRNQALLARSKSGAAQVKSSKNAVQGIDLDTDVLFRFDSATLSGKADATLRTAAEKLKSQPRRKLGIYGHTDGQGSPSYNQDLSLKRAKAVQAALAPLLGSGWTFDVKGYGETRPVAAEKDASGADYPAGRRLNRRVELAVLS